MNAKSLWKIITALEIAAAAAAIILDLFIPTIVILGMIVISLLIRRENIASLGFKKSGNGLRMAGMVLLSVMALQFFQIGITMPVLNRLTGSAIDYSAFANLKGNPGQLALFLIFSWTLAALGEEIVYRGYLQKRLGDLFGTNTVGIILTVGISSLLFGIAHTEQGIIGVVVTTLDALFFSWLKLKHENNLWAAVLAHGFSNSIGLIIFYFTGPIYGLW
jgi:membrane protease YdiL (CAAX protease family)